jgi:hypothetical protein
MHPSWRATTRNQHGALSSLWLVRRGQVHIHGLQTNTAHPCEPVPGNLTNGPVYEISYRTDPNDDLAGMNVRDDCGGHWIVLLRPWTSNGCGWRVAQRGFAAATKTQPGSPARAGIPEQRLSREAAK